MTIYAKDRINLFGVGVDDPVHPPTMQANQIGEVVRDCWNKINGIYKNVKTDVFCLMPNHIHGVIMIGETDGNIAGTGGQGRPPLQKIIQGFKSVSTRMCGKGDASLKLAAILKERPRNIYRFPKPTA